MYGGPSKFLIWRDKWAALFSLLYLSVLFYITYAVFVRSFKFLFSLSGIFILAIIFGPLAWYAYKKYKGLELESLMFYRGRRWEDSVWCELKKLPDDFVVFWGIKYENEKADTDFVIVGPTGVFAVDAKSHDGPIEFDGEKLTRWKRPFEKDVLGQAMHEALSLHEFIKNKLHSDTFVLPVLVFSDFRTSMHFGLNPVKNVFVIQATWLLKLLTEKPRKLSEEQIKEIEGALMPLVQK